MADGRDGLANRRQGGPSVGGSGRVVEARHRQRLRHANAAFVRGDDDPGGGVVVAGDDGCWRVGELPQRGQPRVAGVEVEPSRHDERRVALHPGVAKAFQVAGQAQMARAVTRVALDESDPPMTEPEHVRGQVAAGIEIVGTHGRPVRIGLARRDLHEGDASVDQERCHVGPVGDGCCQQHAVDPGLAHELADGGRRQIVRTRPQQQRVSCARAGGVGTLQQSLDVAELEGVLVDETDGECAPARHSPGRRERLVVQSRYGVLHTLPGLRADVRFVVDDP